MTDLVIGYGAALAFWLAIFSPWTGRFVPFWPGLAAASGLLAAYALLRRRGEMRRLLGFRPLWIGVGLLSAVALYLIFLAGHRLSVSVSHDAAAYVERVYLSKEGASPFLIAALLLWIAPCEEIFWRGFVQQGLAARIGPWRACAAGAVLYSAVHIWTLNPMLLGAALLCGLFWGAMLARCGSLWPCLISHAAWDIAIFVLWPVR